MQEKDVELPIRFEREFQVWNFTVSHGVLLLRSNIDDLPVPFGEGAVA